MESFQKLSLVLDCFTPLEPRLDLQPIGERAGLPTISTHRLLTGLRDSGLVVQDGNRSL
jgi:DNA-binding IclR family transcriptional regulator